jgi:hypothetical protein
MCLRDFLVAALLSASLVFGQPESEVRFTIQLDKVGWYFDDGDPRSFGSVTQSLFPLPAGTAKPMMRNALIADVVSINGKPARGTYASHGVSLNTTNIDFPRNHSHYFVLNLQTAERVQIGDLFGTFLSAGNAAPGAPSGAGNWAVYGGSGAFLGVRGQGSNAGGSNYHVTLMKEDMAVRRTNSAGLLKLDFFLYSANAPEIVGAFHADLTPVTIANPARAGETLTLQVRAHWPTNPPREPGAVFKADPLQVVPNFVEVMVNQFPAEVINRVGWPATRDQYRVDVLLPAIAAGEAEIQLTSAYVPGPPYKIPVR